MPEFEGKVIQNLIKLDDYRGNADIRSQATLINPNIIQSDDYTYSQEPHNIIQLPPSDHFMMARKPRLFGFDIPVLGEGADVVMVPETVYLTHLEYFYKEVRAHTNLSIDVYTLLHIDEHPAPPQRFMSMEHVSFSLQMGISNSGNLNFIGSSNTRSLRGTAESIRNYVLRDQKEISVVTAYIPDDSVLEAIYASFRQQIGVSPTRVFSVYQGELSYPLQGSLFGIAHERILTIEK